MSKLSFRARALDSSKPMPIFLAEELPDLPDYTVINRAVPQMPSGMEKEEESEHHLQRAICTGLIIPTPEVFQVDDIQFYDRCYPSDYKMPKQHIHMQPLWQEQEAPEYDIDSEDDRWLKQQRHPELTELKFEQMMDKLEKCSGQTVVTLNEAKLLLERNDDLLIAVYDYWLNKRLKTQQPLIPTVRTEARGGQAGNNPYLAFRRRTEKMQTRKNRKNDESSYEKMLKLRRDLNRALSLLELVAKREKSKREMVKLTAVLAEKRYQAGDFANHVVQDILPSRVVPIVVPSIVPSHPASVGISRHHVAHSHHDVRQREKRPYKRRKHRHHQVGSVRDSGVYTSSDEESPGRAEAGTPPDDGPYAFRRKPGCLYEMPTATLLGDPVNPDDTSKDAIYQHEIDNRFRFTLTTLTDPYERCIGFARRRIGRGGRLILDRVSTPLDDLWPNLPFHFRRSNKYRSERAEEVEFETVQHRNPKELTRDYHTSGRHPWRHAFRKHLKNNLHLWSKTDDNTIEKIEPQDVHIKSEPMNVDTFLTPHQNLETHQQNLEKHQNLESQHLKLENLESHQLNLEIRQQNLETHQQKLENLESHQQNIENLESYQVKLENLEIHQHNLETQLNKNKSDSESKTLINNSDNRKSDISVSDKRLLESGVLTNLAGVVRKRALSCCSDGSYDSDQSLEPVEQEFEKFISEVNKEWLHFRPKTPPKSPPLLEIDDDNKLEINLNTPLAVELSSALPSSGLDTFTTSEFTLNDLYRDLDLNLDKEKDTSNLDLSNDDLISENLGLTEAQVEIILNETDLKSLDDDKKITEDILDELVKNVDVKDSFLLSGQSLDSKLRKRSERASFGSTSISITNLESSPIVIEDSPVKEVEKPISTIRTVKSEPRLKVESKRETVKEVKSVAKPVEVKLENVSVPVSVPTSKIIVEEVNEVTHIKVEPKRTQPLPQAQPVQQPPQRPATPNRSTHPVKEEIVEELHLAQGVQVCTVQTKHSPLKKHILTAGRRDQLLTVAVSDALKMRLQNHLLQSQAGGDTQVVGLLQNGPFVHTSSPQTVARDIGSVGVSIASSSSPRRVPTPVVLTPSLHQKHQLNQPPVVVAQSHTLQHVPTNKLKVLHAHPLTQSQRTQLLAQSRAAGLTQLPTVVSLATLENAKANPTQLQLKTTPGSVTQFFEIKGGQLGKGTHLVNVVRQPQPGKTTVARLDLNDAKKRQVVATFDGSLKGNIASTTRPHRVQVSLDGRQIVRAALPTVRTPVRHQIQLKNRTLVAPQLARTEPSTSITIAAPTKTASIPSSVVANLLQKNVQLPKAGQKISLSSGGQTLAANVQAIAFTTAQLKARQARLIAQPRATNVGEIVEATTAPVPPSPSSSGHQDSSMEAVSDQDPNTNGAVRRRPTDNLPMEVT